VHVDHNDPLSMFLCSRHTLFHNITTHTLIFNVGCSLHVAVILYTVHKSQAKE